jgi:hypothetical protein
MHDRALKALPAAVAMDVLRLLAERARLLRASAGPVAGFYGEDAWIMPPD